MPRVIPCTQGPWFGHLGPGNRAKHAGTAEVPAHTRQGWQGSAPGKGEGQGQDRESRTAALNTCMLSRVLWVKGKAINPKQDTVNKEMGNKQRNKNSAGWFFHISKQSQNSYTCKNMHQHKQHPEINTAADLTLHTKQNHLKLQQAHKIKWYETATGTQNNIIWNSKRHTK